MGIKVIKKPAPVQAPVVLTQEPDVGGDVVAATNIVAPACEQPAPTEVKDLVLTVEKEYPDGSGTQESMTVGTVHASGPMANVGFSLGMCKNTGNWNNVKFTVSLFVPCEPTLAGMEAAYALTRDFVDTKVSEVAGEIDAQLGS
jgi:hypothetical protein